MGKKNSEEAAVHRSSIALLQERFRQLERVKELREEREQTKALAAGRMSPTAYHEQQQQQPATSKWFIHPELIHPSRPRSGGPSLSLRLHDDNNEVKNFESSISMQPIGYGEGDVDTSLHL